MGLEHAAHAPALESPVALHDVPFTHGTAAAHALDVAFQALPGAVQLHLVGSSGDRTAPAGHRMQSPPPALYAELAHVDDASAVAVQFTVA